jgi:hypothetical protein
VLKEPGRRDDRHIRVRVNHAEDTAEVINVRVRVDHRPHRSITAMRTVER